MRICRESYAKPRHHQISGSNAGPLSYHHFPCLFGGLWYLISPYRAHTVLVHMSCYHTGPFPGAPTGRACSEGTACHVSQLLYVELRVMEERIMRWEKIRVIFLSLLLLRCKV